MIKEKVAVLGVGGTLRATPCRQNIQQLLEKVNGQVRWQDREHRLNYSTDFLAQQCNLTFSLYIFTWVAQRGHTFNVIHCLHYTKVDKLSASTFIWATIHSRPSPKQGIQWAETHRCSLANRKVLSLASENGHWTHWTKGKVAKSCWVRHMIIFHKEPFYGRT